MLGAEAHAAHPGSAVLVLRMVAWSKGSDLYLQLILLCHSAATPQEHFALL